MRTAVTEDGLVIPHITRIGEIGAPVVCLIDGCLIDGNKSYYFIVWTMGDIHRIENVDKNILSQIRNRLVSDVESYYAR